MFIVIVEQPEEENGKPGIIRVNSPNKYCFSTYSFSAIKQNI